MLNAKTRSHHQVQPSQSHSQRSSPVVLLQSRDDRGWRASISGSPTHLTSHLNATTTSTCCLLNTATSSHLPQQTGSSCFSFSPFFFSLMSFFLGFLVLGTPVGILFLCVRLPYSSSPFGLYLFVVEGVVVLAIVGVFIVCLMIFTSQWDTLKPPKHLLNTCKGF